MTVKSPDATAEQCHDCFCPLLRVLEIEGVCLFKVKLNIHGDGLRWVKAVVEPRGHPLIYRLIRKWQDRGIVVVVLGYFSGLSTVQDAISSLDVSVHSGLPVALTNKLVGGIQTLVTWTTSLPYTYYTFSS